MNRAAAALLCLLFIAGLLAGTAGAQSIRVSGQILAYQDGYVFFTTGDGFHVSPSVSIRDASSGKITTLHPRPRLWALATFDASGNVVELDLSHTPLPVEGSFDAVQRFAVALSSPVPNPDLAQPSPNASGIQRTFSGRPVIVVFKVEVPPATPQNTIVYITTDASGWNPQALPMQRIDSLHFQVVERLASGTVFHYLYTRGSFASVERSEGGLDEKPRTVLVSDVDGQVYDNIVYRWADQTVPGQMIQPNVLPTPYNPGPFPNLPPGIHTPHP